MKIIKAGDPNFTQSIFTWMLTNWCNYQCTYCCEKGTMVSQWEKDDSISPYRLILSKLRNYDGEFRVELYGGEPTLHPNLKDIMIALRSMENCKFLQVTTNLSRPLKYFEDLDIPELQGSVIAASFHPEHYDDKFLEKAIAISKMNYLEFRITLVLHDDPKYWPMTLELIDNLTSNGIEYGVHFLTETPHWTPNYTQEFYETFRAVKDTVYKGKVVQLHRYVYDDGSVKEHTDLEIYENDLHRFNGYMCTSRFYEINFNGTIRNTCTRKEYNGLSISREKIEQRTACPRECCSCEMMFNAYKEIV